MHEFSLCKDIISQITKIAKPVEVDEINLDIGLLANVDIESLKFWFQVVATNMSFLDVKLNINNINGIAICENCNTKFDLNRLYDKCPRCNKYADYKIIQGRELIIKSFKLKNK